MPQAVAAWVAEALATSGTYAAGVYTVTYSATTYAIAYGVTYAATTAAVVYGTQAIASRSSGATGAFADAGRNVMVRDTIAPQRKIYGQVLVTGPMYPIGVSGTKNEFFWFAVLIAGHKCADMGDLYFGSEALNDSGSGVPTGKYASNALIGRHDGWADQTADSNVLAAFPGTWTSAHRGRGIAHLIVKLKHDNELYSGLPTVRCMTKGAFVYDPRDAGQDPDDPDTWLWSDNAALCAADFLHDSKFGKGVPWDRIDMDALIEAANICDEDIVLADTTTEKRYTCNGTVTAEQDRNAVLSDLADAMAGIIIDVAGRWIIRAGAWRSPTVTLSEGDLAGGISIQTRQSIQDTYNGVKGVFISPLNDWQPADIIPQKNDTYKAADGGKRRWKDIALNFTTSSPTAQRIEKADLERGRQQITFSALYKLKALQVMPGDVVYHNLSRMGWSNKPFEATDWALKLYDSEGGGKAIGVAITWRETAEGVWDWADGEETEQDLAPNTSLPNPANVAAPTGLALLTDSTTSVTQTDGTFVPRLKATWNTPNNIYVENGGWTRIEYKKHADSDWLVWNTVRGDVLIDYITDVKVGIAYDVRIQHISANGFRSNDGAGTLLYNTVSNYTIAGDNAAPSAPTGLAATTGTGKVVSLDWDDNTEDDFSEYAVWRDSGSGYVKIAEVRASRFVDTDVTIGATYSYKLKAIDRSENQSGFSSVVSATPGAIGSGSLDTSAPSNPSAPTLNTTSSYLAGDGTAFARAVINMPAMPSGAVILNLLYRGNGTTGWIVADQRSAGGSTSTIDDLTPGRTYEYAVQAFSYSGTGSSIITAAATFTAPNDTTLPNGPTSCAFVAGDSSVQRPVPKLYNGVLMYALTITFVESSSKDIAFYEVQGTSSDTDAAASTIADIFGSEWPVPIGAQQAPYYTITNATRYIRIRGVDYSGNRGNWVRIGEASSYLKKPVGDSLERNVGTASGTVAAGDDSRITNAVPNTRTINGYDLSANRTLTASDLSAVPTARTINGYDLSANRSLVASDVGAVPTTRTVNGHALSANVTVTAGDLGLGSSDSPTFASPMVTNLNVGTKVLLTGNPGNTSYIAEDYGLKLNGDSTHPVTVHGGALCLNGVSLGGASYSAGYLYFTDSIYLYPSAGQLFLNDGAGNRALT